MEFIIITLLAIFITIIGALPFGLVNLSVLDTSFRSGTNPALHLSLGAALVEVAFGLVALTAGGWIAHYIKNNPIFYYLVLAVPAVAGLYFLMKGSYKEPSATGKKQVFFKGMLLNLVSIQVLLYWLFAMTYLQTVREFEHTFMTLAFFALGIWIGKMGVLWLYAIFSNQIFSRMGFLSKNINRIIGVVLLFTVVIQLIK
jgi:threonine/homoserine/homoserine lactone efflux protein